MTDYDEVRRLRAEGLTQAEIAKRLDIARSTVWYTLNPGRAKGSAPAPTPTRAVSVRMNGNLRAASVPGREGFPTIVVAHRDEIPERLIERARLIHAQSRFAGLEHDLEDDPS